MIVDTPISWPVVCATGLADRSDETLVKLAKKGDDKAFSELVLRHQHIVFNLAYRFMRDRTAAEDMTQEAFLRAFRMLKGFRGDAAFSTWMYRVTCSVCLTEVNRRKKRGEVPLGPYQDALGAVEQPEHTDLPELVRSCVAQLPDRYATIITLYYFQTISYEEIARIMDIPMGTLKIWMYRARKQLKEIVESELPSHALKTH